MRTISASQKHLAVLAGLYSREGWSWGISDGIQDSNKHHTVVESINELDAECIRLQEGLAKFHAAVNQVH